MNKRNKSDLDIHPSSEMKSCHQFVRSFLHCLVQVLQPCTFPLSLSLSIWYISKTLVDLLAHGRHGRSYSVVLEVDHLVANEDWGLTS